LNDSDGKDQVGIPSRILRAIRKLSTKNPPDLNWEDERNLWDTRYRQKGTSGPGSIGENRSWKWKYIDQFVDVSKKSVLDIGCGDLSFWEGRNCESYVGLDFSEFAIERNRTNRPSWTFYCGDASEKHDFSGEVAFCFDVLFHIMSEEKYERILANLAKWTKKRLFIYTWWKSPFGSSNTDDKYQYFRSLMKSVDILAPLKIVNETKHTEIGALYVFKKQ